MAQNGGSCHSDDEDHGVKAFWADQEHRQIRKGDFARHRPKDARDWVYGAANLDFELSGGRFRDGRSRTQAPVTVDGGQSLPPTPVFSNPRVKNPRNTAGDVFPPETALGMDFRHFGRIEPRVYLRDSQYHDAPMGVCDRRSAQKRDQPVVLSMLSSMKKRFGVDDILD